MVGLAVFDNTGNGIAQSENLPQETIVRSEIETVMDSNEADGTFVRSGSFNLYAFTIPLYDDERVIGAVTVVQNATYIDEGVRQVWINNASRLLMQIILFALTVFLLLRFVIFKPLTHMTETIRSLRAGIEPGAKVTSSGFWEPLSSEISKMTRSLKQARSAASEEARMRLEKLDTPWTAERLKEYVKAYLKNRTIIVVSNRGSHTPNKTRSGVEYIPVAGGMTTALTALMEACGGTWIATGRNKDRAVLGPDGKLAMPPDEGKYILKSVLLADKEAHGHYQFSAEAMYPLCLITHVRPTFKKEDWVEYCKVNGEFAREILREITNMTAPIILINDYHFALLPAMIKKSRPDVRVGLFWHVPWPNEEYFSICPWRREILEGMLGADVVGFNTQQFCNQFMDTVSKEIESVIDWDQFSIVRTNHRTYIKPFAVSIAFTNGHDASALQNSAHTLDPLDIQAKYIGLGVDRLDYTKGIPERFHAIEHLLNSHPELVGHFTFIQIASPHRQHIKKYQEYKGVVEGEAERINRKFETNTWKPIVLEIRQYSHEELTQLYKRADVCVVTSLHDSMNLVAKEYAAARDDENGALVLSKFAGASRDLKGAFIVNPYSPEETSDAIAKSLTLSPSERRLRMKSMRDSIKNYNVYRWAAEFIKAVADLG